MNGALSRKTAKLEIQYLGFHHGLLTTRTQKQHTTICVKLNFLLLMKENEKNKLKMVRDEVTMDNRKEESIFIALIKVEHLKEDLFVLFV